MRTALLGGALVACSLAGVALAVVPDTAGFRPGAPVFAGSTRVTDLPEYGGRGTDVVAYRHGARLRMTVPLTNTGRLPVRVTSVDLGGQRFPLLAVTRSEGVQLGAGQTAPVVLEAVLGNCRYFHERELSTYDALRVRFEVLGRSGERRVPLARPLVVKSPMIVGCPDRKLDRQAFDRTQ